MLVESLLLACGGGLLGVFGALWGVQALTTFLPESLSKLQGINIDARVVVHAWVDCAYCGCLWRRAGVALHARRRARRSVTLREIRRVALRDGMSGVCSWSLKSRLQSCCS